MQSKVTNVTELEENLENCQTTADQFGLTIVAVRIGEALDALKPPVPRDSNGSSIN